MIYKFTNTNGIPMVARLVAPDDNYGNEGCLIADKCMIEFYMETEYKHNQWLKEMCDLDHHLYFISRYHLDTFLFGYNGASSLERGLCLDGAAREYDLTDQECRLVVANLFMRLAKFTVAEEFE